MNQMIVGEILYKREKFRIFEKCPFRPHGLPVLNIFRKPFYISMTCIFCICLMCNSLFWPNLRNLYCRSYSFHQRAYIFHRTFYSRCSCILRFQYTRFVSSIHYNFHDDRRNRFHIHCKTRGSFSTSILDFSDIRHRGPKWRNI